jgi:hypothetical protein
MLVATYSARLLADLLLDVLIQLLELHDPVPVQVGCSL